MGVGLGVGGGAVSYQPKLFSTLVLEKLVIFKTDALI